MNYQDRWYGASKSRIPYQEPDICLSEPEDDPVVLRRTLRALHDAIVHLRECGDLEHYSYDVMLACPPNKWELLKDAIEATRKVLGAGDEKS